MQAIILSPTGTSNANPWKEMERIGKYNGSRITCVYGGSDIERQIRTIKRIDIIGPKVFRASNGFIKS